MSEAPPVTLTVSGSGTARTSPDDDDGLGAVDSAPAWLRGVEGLYAEVKLTSSILTLRGPLTRFGWRCGPLLGGSYFEATQPDDWPSFFSICGRNYRASRDVARSQNQLAQYLEAALEAGRGADVVELRVDRAAALERLKDRRRASREALRALDRRLGGGAARRVEAYLWPRRPAVDAAALEAAARIPGFFYPGDLARVVATGAIVRIVANTRRRIRCALLPSKAEADFAPSDLVDAAAPLEPRAAARPALDADAKAPAKPANKANKARAARRSVKKETRAAREDPAPTIKKEPATRRAAKRRKTAAAAALAPDLDAWLRSLGFDVESHEYRDVSLGAETIEDARRLPGHPDFEDIVLGWPAEARVRLLEAAAAPADAVGGIDASPASLEFGSRCWALFAGAAQPFYGGTVVSPPTAAGRLRVVWDDGQISKVSLRHVFRRIAPATFAELALTAPDARARAALARYAPPPVRAVPPAPPPPADFDAEKFPLIAAL